MKKILITILVCLTNYQAFGGGSMDFTQPMSKISLGSPVLFDNMRAMSITVWLKAKSPMGTGVIATKRATNTGWRLNQNFDGIVFVKDAGTDMTVICDEALNVGEWVFLSATHNGGTAATEFRVYITTSPNVPVSECNNYRVRTNAVLPYVNDSPNLLLFGSQESNTSGYDGNMFNFTISSAVLTLSQIREAQNCADFIPPNMIGKWYLWDSTKTTDMSGLGNHGVHIGQVDPSNDGPPTNFCYGGS